MKKVTLLKLGGSLITDKTKPFTANLDIIEDLVSQIKKAIETSPNLRLIIGNGAGSFAHYPAVKFNMKEGIKNEKQKTGFCEVQSAATKLNRIIVEELLKKKVKAISLNPSSMIISKNGKIKDFFIKPIIGLISLGITPVIYGDIVYDEQLGSKIYSTEQLLSEIAIRLKKAGFLIEKIIHNGITKGVLDSNKNLIPTITLKNIKVVKKFLNGARGYDVTGGMMHKVVECLKLKKQGIKSLIINGTAEKDLLTNALLGNKVVGTMIN